MVKMNKKVFGVAIKSALVLLPSVTFAQTITVVDFTTIQGANNLVPYNGTIPLPQLKSEVNKAGEKIKNARSYGEASSYANQVANVGISTTSEGFFPSGLTVGASGSVDTYDLVMAQYPPSSLTQKQRNEKFISHNSVNGVNSTFYPMTFNCAVPWVDKAGANPQTPYMYYFRSLFKYGARDVDAEFHNGKQLVYKAKNTSTNNINLLYRNVFFKRIPIVNGYIDNKLKNNTNYRIIEPKDFTINKSLLQQSNWQAIRTADNNANASQQKLRYQAFKYKMPDGKEKIVVATIIGFYFSMDGGKTWSKGC